MPTLWFRVFVACVLVSIAGCAEISCLFQRLESYHGDSGEGWVLTAESRRQPVNFDFEWPAGALAMHTDVINIRDPTVPDILHYTKRLQARRTSLLYKGKPAQEGPTPEVAAVSDDMSAMLVQMVPELSCMMDADAPSMTVASVVAPAALSRDGFVLSHLLNPQGKTHGVSSWHDAVQRSGTENDFFNITWMPYMHQAMRSDDLVSVSLSFAEAECRSLRPNIAALHVTVSPASETTGWVQVLVISKTERALAGEHCREVKNIESVLLPERAASLLPMSAVRRSIVGTGFHRELVYTIPSAIDCSNADSCVIMLLQPLDSTAYVDLDELRDTARHTGAKFHCFSRNIDVERPTELSSQHFLAVWWPVTTANLTEHRVSLMTHMRYQSSGCQLDSHQRHTAVPVTASFESTKQLYPNIGADSRIPVDASMLGKPTMPGAVGCYAFAHIPQGTLFVHKTRPDGSTLIQVVEPALGFTAWADRAGFDAAATPQMALIPVGVQAQSDTVALVTTLAAMGGAIYLTIISFLYR